jgi:predicted nucleotidyltransferase
LSSILVKSVDPAKIRRSVDEYARRLFAEHPEVEEIVVFGSFAKGTYAAGSDVDILIVLSDSDRPFRDRIPELLPGAFPVGLDLFPYTRAEIASRLSPGFLAAIEASDWRYRRPPP